MNADTTLCSSRGIYVALGGACRNQWYPWNLPGSPSSPFVREENFQQFVAGHGSVKNGVGRGCMVDESRHLVGRRRGRCKEFLEMFLEFLALTFNVFPEFALADLNGCYGEFPGAHKSSSLWL